MSKWLLGILALLPLPAFAADDNGLGGIWQGTDGPTSYTRLLVKDESNVTYCYMQSCHELACSDWQVTGNTNGQFEYSNAMGKWNFTRVSPEKIEGAYKNVGGDIFHVSYEPE